MHRRPIVGSFGALLLAAFGIASAQNAFTSRPMNVRAGPNRDYPLVAQLGAGAPLDIYGCLSDWSWCDASFGGGRGWIYAGGLSFLYQGERVPLYSYGPHLGLPILTFSLLSYWNNYYRGRPWYAQRNTWAHRRMPPHLRPPGRPHAGPPPAPRGRSPMSRRRPSTPQGRPAMPQGRPAMPQGRPAIPQGRPSAPRGQPPGHARPTPRTEQRGHAGSSGRPAQRPEHTSGAAAHHGSSGPARGQSHERDNGGRREGTG